jgi:hypothetical protein
LVLVRVLDQQCVLGISHYGSLDTLGIAPSERPLIVPAKLFLENQLGRPVDVSTTP